MAVAAHISITDFYQARGTSLLALLTALILSFTRMTAYEISTTMALTASRTLIFGLLLLVCIALVPGATEFIYFIF